MEVLLLQDVDNLGLAGDITNVADGYGRNYLLPQELAVLATSSARKQAEAIRKAGEARRAREKADAQAIANQLRDVVLVFERRAGDREQLYGSVTSRDIVTEIETKHALEIDRRKLVLPEPLRSLGEFEVEVRLMVEVSVNLKVVVIKEGTTYKPQAAQPEPEPVAEAPAEPTPVAEVEAPADVEPTA
jgi:large subunit ribosomal protein L9